MKRLAAVILTVMLALSLSGCFFLKSSSSRHKITTYFDENTEVVAARVWSREHRSDDLVIIEAREEDLDALVEELDKTRLSIHFGVADYFYKGFYGIELTLADGTYLIYDCTELELTDKPFDYDDGRYDSIKDEYLEDVNRDLWDRIERFFPGMEDCSFSYGW